MRNNSDLFSVNSARKHLENEEVRAASAIIYIFSVFKVVVFLEFMYYSFLFRKKI